MAIFNQNIGYSGLGFAATLGILGGIYSLSLVVKSGSQLLNVWDNEIEDQNEANFIAANNKTAVALAAITVLGFFLSTISFFTGSYLVGKSVWLGISLLSMTQKVFLVAGVCLVVGKSSEWVYKHCLSNQEPNFD